MVKKCPGCRTRLSRANGDWFRDPGSCKIGCDWRHDQNTWRSKRSSIDIIHNTVKFTLVHEHYRSHSYICLSENTNKIIYEENDFISLDKAKKMVKLLSFS